MTAAIRHRQFLLPDGRHLGVSEVGDAHSPQVLLCLPGLLETRASFEPVLAMASHCPGLRVISVDHAGRGDSSRLPGDVGYCMSRYVDDVAALLHTDVIRAGQPVPELDLLGTSMGGIMAMYLTSERKHHVKGLWLNDIGLDLNWLSIYGLYDQFKKDGLPSEPVALAAQLNVSVGAVLAVQSPSHFDLPYRKDWRGMKFGHWLDHFKGRVRLVHGAESGVCSAQQVRDLCQRFPTAQVLEVPGASHPAPLDAHVCAFLLQGAARPESDARPFTHGQHPIGSEQEPTHWWHRLKRRYLGATKR